MEPHRRHILWALFDQHHTLFPIALITVFLNISIVSE